MQGLPVGEPAGVFQIGEANWESNTHESRILGERAEFVMPTARLCGLSVEEIERLKLFLYCWYIAWRGRRAFRIHNFMEF
jgi:hypothetical protein